MDDHSHFFSRPSDASSDASFDASFDASSDASSGAQLSTRALVLLTLLATAFTALPTFAGVLPYDLVFGNPTPPLFVNEGEVLSVDVTITGGCVPFAGLIWDSAAVDITADGSDYGVPAPNMLSFSDGQLTMQVQVPIFGDAIPEGNETFELQITNLGDPTMMPCGSMPNQTIYSTVVTIVDVAPPELSISDTMILEGDAGSQIVQVPVTLTNQGVDSVLVDYQTVDNTATTTDGDYMAVNDTLIFTGGARGPQTQFIDVTIFGDTNVEIDEDFLVHLFNPIGAVIIEDTAEVTIQNDDFGSPEFGIVDFSVPEEIGNAVALINLSPPAQGAASIEVFTFDNTAIGGQDFTAVPVTVVNFMAGETQKPFNIAITDDMLVEGPESFFFKLQNPTGAGLSSMSDAEVTIDDNDAGPGPTLIIHDLDVLEGDAGSPNVLVTVEVQNPEPISYSYSVDWTTQDGTATTANNDYLMGGGTVQINFPDTTAQIFVPVVGDTDVEPDEFFTIELFNAMGGATIDDDQAVVTIENDDGGGGLELSIGDAQVTEGNVGTVVMEFLVELSSPEQRPTRGAIQVDYRTLDDSATAPDDYLPSSGTLTFLPGDTQKTIAVNVRGDLLVEGDEEMSVELSNPVGAIITQDKGVGTILDDEGTSGFRAIDTSIVEGNSGNRLAEFTVARTPPLGDTATVEFITEEGSASAGEDYFSRAGTLTFDPGEAQKTIQVPVVGDTEDEDNEDFFLTLSNPDGAVLEDAQARCVIVDDDGGTPTPLVSIDDVEVAEGDEGPTDATFTVMLSQARQVPVSIDYTTVDGSATAEDMDYQAQSGQIDFAPGQTNQTVTIQVAGDRRDEGDEFFTVELGNPVGAVLDRHTGRCDILDDDEDGGGGSTLAIDDVQVTEGDAGFADAVFTVTLSPATNRLVRVAYRTEEVSATAGQDFIATEGTLEFLAGRTTRQITVRVRGDRLEEMTETFSVQLSEPFGATIEDGLGVGTIVDDDAVVLPTLSINNVQVAEGDEGITPATFSVRLSQAVDWVVTADFQTADETAMAADGDYRATAGMVRFEAGETTTTIAVPVLGDQRAEDDETFVVELSNVDGAQLVQAIGRATIIDDDSGPGQMPTFIRLVRSPPILESEGRVVIVAERGGDLSGPTRAALLTRSGTARAGQDYSETRTRIVWPPGRRLVEVEIPITNDVLQEGEEFFAVLLREAQGAELAQPNDLRQVIVDDDTPMRLEAVGDQEITTEVRRELDLSVRVVRQDGAPVAGALVNWRIVDGDARLAGEGRGRSDEDGLVVQRLLLPNRPGIVRVAAQLAGSDSEVGFALEVEGDLASTVGTGGGGNNGDGNLAQALDKGCANTSGQHAETCDYLFGLQTNEDKRMALDQLTPRAALAQGQAALRSPKNQIRNVSTRLSALRGGIRRQALSQLAFDLRGEGLSLGPLQEAIASYRGTDEALLAQTVENALGSAAHGRSTPLGGGASGDDGGKNDRGNDGLLDAYDATESPWGFFFNGRASFGDAPRRGNDPGYDFHTEGLTAGIDYRMSDRFVLGAALGFLQSDNDVAQDGGSAEVSGLSLSIYTTYYRDNFYLDGVFSYGSNDYDIQRVLDLPIAFRGQTRFVAVGRPDSDQLSATIGAGYDFLLGDALSLGGFVRLNYVSAEIDPYVESGAAVFNLAFQQQEIESLLAEAGFELSYPFSFNWGVLQPTVRLAYLREFEDDVQLIRARFALDPQNRQFVVESERPDRQFLNLAAALTATLQRGWATYFQFDTDLQREDLDIYTLSGGFRLQF